MRQRLSRVIGLRLGALMLCLCATTAQADSFTLLSQDFKAGQLIPIRFIYNGYGCSGGNLSPALEWRGVPAGTKSFALTVFDPDEKSTGSGWWHWVLYDVPAQVTRLPQGAGVEKSKTLPAGAIQGRTDISTAAYHGPCPDPGQSPHHYVFTLYALSVTKLPVPPEASGAMVTETVQSVTLAKATLVGVYGR